jgi:hypothetical protein
MFTGDKWLAEAFDENCMIPSYFTLFSGVMEIGTIVAKSVKGAINGFNDTSDVGKTSV